MLTRLTELIEAHNVFVRERKPNWIRSLGIALVYLGLSCRQTAEVLRFSDVDKASHEAVRQWYHRAKALLRNPSKRHRSTVAIESTRRRSRWKDGGAISGRRSTRRAGSCSACSSRRRGTVTVPPVSYGARYRCARTRRWCSWTGDRGIQRHSAGWACRGNG